MQLNSLKKINSVPYCNPLMAGLTNMTFALPAYNTINTPLDYDIVPIINPRLPYRIPTLPDFLRPETIF
jgi:hypothetical protein